jgi:hypothetical protein
MENRLKKIWSQMHPISTLRDFHKKKGLGKSSKPLILLVRQAGFEPAAYGFVVRRSIRAELLALAKAFEI